MSKRTSDCEKHLIEFKRFRRENEKKQNSLDELRYKINLILSGLRNLLELNNPSGVNDYIIGLIGRGENE